MWYWAGCSSRHGTGKISPPAGNKFIHTHNNIEYEEYELQHRQILPSYIDNIWSRAYFAVWVKPARKQEQMSKKSSLKITVNYVTAPQHSEHNYRSMLKRATLYNSRVNSNIPFLSYVNSRCLFLRLYFILNLHEQRCDVHPAQSEANGRQYI